MSYAEISIMLTLRIPSVILQTWLRVHAIPSWVQKYLTDLIFWSFSSIGHSTMIVIWIKMDNTMGHLTGDWTTEEHQNFLKNFLKSIVYGHALTTHSVICGASWDWHLLSVGLFIPATPRPVSIRSSRLGKNHLSTEKYSSSFFTSVHILDKYKCL